MSSMKRSALSLATGLALTLAIKTLAAAPLLEEARLGNTQAALDALQSSNDVNAAESNGTTVLHWAAHNGDVELVRALVTAGADVNVLNRYGASPLSEAVTLGSVDIVRILLEAGADAESPNGDGMTALMIAARSNHVELAKLLLQHGADVNAIEQWRQQNAVIWAAAQGQPEMLRVLIDAGGDPNSRSMANERDRQISAERRFQWRTAGGMTALVYAAREGCLECVRILVDAGADIDQGDIENVTPLLAAIINMRFDTAKYLVQAGANVNKWSFRGENPIYSAVDVNTVPHGGYPDRPSMDATSSLEMIRILLTAGANPNLQLKLQPTYRHIKDDRGADRMLNIGATPLLRAAKAFDIPAMQLLLQHGALVDLPNRDGTTPLMAAAGLSASSIDTRGDYSSPFTAQHSKDTLAMLLAAGADINATDNAGRTALHGAAGWGWNEAVEFLAQNGAHLKAQDRNGRTPLDHAMGNTAADGGRGGGGEVRKQTAELIQNLLLAN